MMQDWLDQPLRRIVAIVVVTKVRQRIGQQGKKTIEGIMKTQREVSISVPFTNLQFLHRYDWRMNTRPNITMRI
jgi:hypothetical protein